MAGMIKKCVSFMIVLLKAYIHNSCVKWSALHFAEALLAEKCLGNFANVEQLRNFWAFQEAKKQPHVPKKCPFAQHQLQPRDLPPPQPLRLCHNYWYLPVGGRGSLPRGCTGFYSQTENIYWWTFMSIIPTEYSMIAGGGDAPLLATMAQPGSPPPVPTTQQTPDIKQKFKTFLFGLQGFLPFNFFFLMSGVCWAAASWYRNVPLIIVKRISL